MRGVRQNQLDYDHDNVSQAQCADVHGIRRLGRLDARLGGAIDGPVANDGQANGVDLRHAALGEFILFALRWFLGGQVCRSAVDFGFLSRRWHSAAAAGSAHY